jgi:hypothetical protein
MTETKAEKIARFTRDATMTQGQGGPPISEPLHTLLKWCAIYGLLTPRDDIRLDEPGCELPETALAALGFAPTDDGPRPTEATVSAAALLWTNSDPEMQRGGEGRVVPDEIIDASDRLALAADMERFRRLGLWTLEPRGIFAPDGAIGITPTAAGYAVGQQLAAERGDHALAARIREMAHANA